MLSSLMIFAAFAFAFFISCWCHFLSRAFRYMRHFFWYFIIDYYYLFRLVSHCFLIFFFHFFIFFFLSLSFSLSRFSYFRRFALILIFDAERDAIIFAIFITLSSFFFRFRWYFHFLSLIFIFRWLRRVSLLFSLRFDAAAFSPLILIFRYFEHWCRWCAFFIWYFDAIFQRFSLFFTPSSADIFRFSFLISCAGVPMFFFFDFSPPSCFIIFSPLSFFDYFLSLRCHAFAIWFSSFLRLWLLMLFFFFFIIFARFRASLFQIFHFHYFLHYLLFARYFRDAFHATLSLFRWCWWFHYWWDVDYFRRHADDADIDDYFCHYLHFDARFLFFSRFSLIAADTLWYCW